MTETENQIEDCPRCGSLLPDAEEGLCPTCGYEFGRATLYMPVVRLDDDDPQDLPAGVLDEAPATAPTPTAPLVPAPPPTMAAPQQDGRKVLIAVLVVIVLFVVALIGAATILLFSTVEGQPADAVDPPSIEAPAPSE